MSWLIWFMPSSTRSSCSGQDKDDSSGMNFIDKNMRNDEQQLRAVSVYMCVHVCTWCVAVFVDCTNTE